VDLVRDKVVRVETTEKKILAVHTAGGVRFSSWFIDASGFAACFLPRELNLPAIQFGPAKVALWAYFPVTESIEGTTLYMDPVASEYLDWVWEIPISSDVVSVGYVTTGAATKVKRDQGLSVEDIFRQQLMKFPRFEPLLRAGAENTVNVTSYRSRAHAGVAGPNWLVAGEAASMVDPGRSHHRQRGDGRASACGGSVPADSEIPQAGQAAVPRTSLLQQPHSADGEVL
jgi:menaquinone-9 beta-reductase